MFPCYREEFDKHFSPPYNPWEQRFCLAPKGDFYKALGTDKADIVTGHIETFTENGIKMKDGTFIEVRFSRRVHHIIIQLLLSSCHVHYVYCHFICRLTLSLAQLD